MRPSFEISAIDAKTRLPAAGIPNPPRTSSKKDVRLAVVFDKGEITFHLSSPGSTLRYPLNEYAILSTSALSLPAVAHDRKAAFLATGRGAAGRRRMTVRRHSRTYLYHG